MPDAQAGSGERRERVAGEPVHVADAVRRELLAQLVGDVADDDGVDRHAAAGLGQRRART